MSIEWTLYLERQINRLLIDRKIKRERGRVCGERENIYLCELEIETEMERDIRIEIDESYSLDGWLIVSLREIN